MKVKAHLIVMKGYALAISANQWRGDLEQQAEEHNQRHYAPGYDDEPEHDSTYLEHDRDRAVITVEFDVPDELFMRQAPIIVPANTEEKQ